MACHHLRWMENTVERRWAWHDITSFVQHTRLNDVGCGMPSSPLGSTNGRTTSGVACYHHLWAAHTVERRRSWHAIIAFRLADTVGRRRAWHAIIALGRQTWSNDVGRGMPSLPFGSTGGQTASGVACHHRLWALQTVEHRRPWNAIVALGRQTQYNDVKRDMPSPPLESTHGRTTLGVA